MLSMAGKAVMARGNALASENMPTKVLVQMDAQEGMNENSILGTVRDLIGAQP